MMKNYERMIQLFERMGRLGTKSALLGDSDLTFSQLAILACVGRMPGGHLNEIAETLDLTAPTVSVALKKLEEGQWIQRQSDPQDGRAIRVHLTTKGLDVMKAMRAHRKSRIKRFLSALHPDEQNQLLRLLEKASEQMDGE